MRRLLSSFTAVLAALLALCVMGCDRGEKELERSLGFDEFVPLYNRYIGNWLRIQQTATLNEAKRLEAEIAAAEGEEKELLEGQLEANLRDQEKWEYRLSLGDYLAFGEPADVPDDLVWKDGMDQPEIGDPAAKKGGVYRTFIPTFPPTIRPFGDNSNNSFRGNLYDNIVMPLVNLHPETLEIIPAVAKEWAVSGDGRTVYFRLDPEARYSDGVPVRARDFLVSVYLRVSDNLVNPYAKQYFREEFARFVVYGDDLLSISVPEAKYYAPLLAGSLFPEAPHFYEEYGPDYAERYQWRFPPTTGAYEVREEDIVKGASITQTRVKDWWAKDKKYYKHRFNPDKIVHTVVRDESKAFELFRAGEIDTFLLTRPEFWYEKSEMPPVYDGYVERVTFYTRYPKIPTGIYMNVTRKPLDDRNVRLGIQHAMNWRKVIDVLYRGDYQRLNSFNEGYIPYSDPSIRARPFSNRKAREYFREAGYTETGRDGILKKPDGTRLSISVTYGAMPIRDRMFAILREEARKCGLDLRLDGLEFTVSYRKIMQKQHDMVFTGWIITPPVPDYYQFMHSSNALDEKGNPRTQTNNIFVWARPDTDRLSIQVRNATTVEELRAASWKLQNIIHDEGIFVPGYAVDFVRVGSWRWVRWPDCENTRFAPPVVFDPHDTHVLWIDEEIRRETQAARRTGRVFEESTRIEDTYRLTNEKSAPAEEKPPEEEETGEETEQP